jgi:hypothetical protein
MSKWIAKQVREPTADKQLYSQTKTNLFDDDDVTCSSFWYIVNQNMNKLRNLYIRGELIQDFFKEGVSVDVHG